MDFIHCRRLLPRLETESGIDQAVMRVEISSAGLALLRMHLCGCVEHVFLDIFIYDSQCEKKYRTVLVTVHDDL